MHNSDLSLIATLANPLKQHFCDLSFLGPVNTLRARAFLLGFLCASFASFARHHIHQIRDCLSSSGRTTLQIYIKLLPQIRKYNAYVVPGVAHYEGPEPDDALHDPGPRLKAEGPDRRLSDSRAMKGHTSFFSWRGWLNMIALLLVLGALIGLFAA